MQKHVLAYGALDLFPGVGKESAKLYGFITVQAVLCIVYMLLGAGVIVVKVAIHASSPVFFELLRQAVAAPLLFVLAALLGHRCLPEVRDAPRICAAGLCLFISQMTSIVGLKLTSPVVATVWQSSAPIWIASLAVLSGREKVGVQKALGISVAVAGCIFIVISDAQLAGEGEAHMSHRRWGHLLLFTKCVFGSAYRWLMQDLSTRYHVVPILANCLAFATGLSLALHCFITKVPLLLEFTCWSNSQYMMEECFDGAWLIRSDIGGALAYEVLFGTILAWLLLHWANRQLKASEAAAFVTIQPATACGVSSCLFMSKGPAWAMAHGIWLPGARNVFGVLLIIVGLLLTMLDRVYAQPRTGEAGPALVHNSPRRDVHSLQRDQEIAIGSDASMPSARCAGVA